MGRDKQKQITSKPRPMTKRAPKVRRSHKLLVGVCLLAATIAVGVSSIDLLSQSRELEVTEAELLKQLEEAQALAKEIEEFEEYSKTEEYIEEVAREKLGLVYPDEIVLKPEQ